MTRSLDREIKNQYSLLIQATDGGGLMDFMKLDISVKDINDNRPIFAQDKYEVSTFTFYIFVLFVCLFLLVLIQLTSIEIKLMMYI